MKILVLFISMLICLKITAQDVVIDNSTKGSSIAPYWRKGTGPTVYPTWYNNRGAVTNNITYNSAKTSVENGASLEIILESLSAGANVVIHAGTYTISNRFEITAVGTALNPVFISGATGESVIITRPDANQNCINANNSAYVVLEGITITNGSTGIKFGPGTADHWMIYNCKFFAVNNAAIAANSNDSSYLYVIDCEIYNTGGVGEGLYMGTNYGVHKNHHSYYCGNYIHDLTVNNVNFQGDGIEIKDGSYANTVKYNYITNTNYPGITIYGTQKGSVDRNVIEGNVVVNSNDYALQFSGEAIVRNNLIINNNNRAIYSKPTQNAVPGYLDFCNNTVLSSDRALNANSWTGRPNIIVANNFLYSSISDYIGGSTGSAVVTNNIQKNVLTDLINLTVNGANLELRPHPVNGTALINTASATYLPAVDILGYPRALTNDVGAQNSWIPIITENSTVSVNEGSSTIAKLKLGVKPISNINIQMPHQTGDTTLSLLGGEPSIKTFTTANWSAFQNVQINAAEDADVLNGTAAYLISKSSGTDITNSTTINVNVIDNDLADTTPPSVPTSLASASITATTFTLSWTASTDAVGVTGYKIYKGGSQIGTSATSNFAVTGLTAATTYSFTVSAYDAAGNNSSQSSALSVTTTAAPDTTAPSIPTGLASASITQTTFTLSWTASTDAVGVTGYKIYKGGVQIGSSATNSFAVTSLIASTTYSFTVSAYDAAGNNSLQSSSLSVSTSAASDTTAPSIPNGLVSSAITQTTFTLSWTASTDAVGVTGYKIYKDGTQIGTSATNSYAVTSLIAATTYSFSVSAYDAASNNSAQSSVLSVKTSAATVTATYTVGAGKTYAKISDLLAAKTLAAGNIVEIYPGTYNEANLWGSANSGTVGNPIIVRGIGIKPLIDGTGISLAGSPDSLFMVYSNNIVFENLEFKNGGTNDGGSGIRLFNNNVTIRNCKITNCAIGVSSAGTATGTIVEYTEIADCIDLRSTNWGHNVYMNSDSIFRYCYIHDSGKANNFKTRGHYTELLYNYIADANSAEIDIVDSTSTTTANSNAVLIGNIIIKRNAVPKSGFTGNNTQFIKFGQDVGGTRNGTLYLINNTIIAGMTANIVLQLNSTTNAICYNNIFFGSNNLMFDSYSTTNTFGSNNWIPSTATNPTNLTSTLQGTDPNFVNAATRDYHLTSIATSVNAGLNTPTYLDGSGVSHPAMPSLEYVNHTQNIARKSDGLIDRGAYEYSSVSGDTTAPTIPTSLASASITPTTFTLSWTASTDAVGVTGYKIFKGGVQIGTSITNNYAVTGLTASTTYSFTVSAYDAAVNNSGLSSALSVTTIVAPDVTPPTAPTTLSAASISQTTFTLSWAASTDAVGVTGYKIFKGGVQIGTSATTNYAVTGLSASTTYSFTVSAYDAAANNSTLSSARSVTTIATPDTTPPTAPTTLVAASITPTTFTLSWTASTDAVGVTGYKIFKGGVQIGTSATTNFAVTGLTTATTYSFTVSAYDAAANNSTLSSALSVTTTTTTDTTPPTAPTTLVAASITPTTFTLSWTASTDAVGVTGYKIFKGGVQIGTSATTNFAVTGLTTATTYSFTVSAYDAATNNSSLSSALSVTTTTTTDTTPPTAPTTLAAASISQTTFTLSWIASTDAVGVTGYKIFKGGVQIGTSATTNFAVTGLTAFTTYSFTVSAYDAAANNSTLSSALSVKTLAIPDTTPPTNPTSLIATLITPTTFTLSWTASTDAVGVTGYKIFKGGAQIGTSATTSFAVTGLTTATTYSFTVSAYDAATNNSTLSSALSVTTISTTDTTPPTTPTTLSSSLITATTFTLAWTASTDAVGVTGYKIFKGGVQIGTSASTNFAVTGLTASTTYSFTVSAYDAAANNSVLSSALSVTTLSAPDTTAPTTPTSLTSASITTTTFTLSWTASADAVGVTGYKIFIGGVQIGTSATNSFAVTGLIASTSYSLTVSAYDAASNNSTLSGALSVTTLVAPDTVAPTVPTNLFSANLTTTTFTLNWTPSTDAIGVTGYNIFNGVVKIGTSVTTSFDVTGLQAATTYTFTVTAFDSAGNNSSNSTGLSVITLTIPDTTAPSIPTNLSASTISATSLQLSWLASTDNVNVLNYKIFQNGSLIGTTVSTSLLINNLNIGTTYNFTVSAIDAAGNNSALSTTLPVTTSNITFTVTSSNEINGSISPLGIVTVNSGSSKTYNISPAVGFEIDSIFVDGASVGAVSSYTFNSISTNHTINASFKIKTFTIVATAGSNGQISPAGNIILNENSTQTFLMTPLAGFQVSEVLIDGVSVGATTRYTFKNIVVSHTIAVSFKQNKFNHNLTSLTTTGNTSSPLNHIKVTNLTNNSFTITPVDGYEVDNAIIDGVNVSELNNNSFSTLELIVGADTNLKASNLNELKSSNDKSYLSSGKAILDFNRLEGAQGSLKVNYEALRYTASNDTDVTMISGTLSWSNGDANTKTIGFSELSSGVDSDEIFSVKILSIEEDLTDTITDTTNTGTTGTDGSQATGSSNDAGGGGGGCSYAPNMSHENQAGNILLMFGFMLILLLKRKRNTKA